MVNWRNWKAYPKIPSNNSAGIQKDWESTLSPSFQGRICKVPLKKGGIRGLSSNNTDASSIPNPWYYMLFNFAINIGIPIMVIILALLKHVDSRESSALTPFLYFCL